MDSFSNEYEENFSQFLCSFHLSCFFFRKKLFNSDKIIFLETQFENLAYEFEMEVLLFKDFKRENSIDEMGMNRELIYIMSIRT